MSPEKNFGILTATSLIFSGSVLTKFWRRSNSNTPARRFTTATHTLFGSYSFTPKDCRSNIPHHALLDRYLNSQLRFIPTSVQTRLFALHSTHNSNKKTLVILGSGWGSTSLLKDLDTDAYNVIVVSPRNYFLFTRLSPFHFCLTLSFASFDDNRSGRFSIDHSTA